LLNTYLKSNYHQFSSDGAFSLLNSVAFRFPCFSLMPSTRLWISCSLFVAFLFGFACQWVGAMLQFIIMKRLASAALRFFLSFVIAEVCVAIYVAAMGYKAAWGQPLASLALWSLWTLPALPTSFALLTSFFTLNRVYKHRWSGYMTLLVLSLLTLGAPLALSRFGLLTIRLETLPAFDSALGDVLRWYQGLDGLPPLEAIAGVSSLALVLSSCWSLTRLSAKRPLVGAFLVPGALVGMWYLLSIYIGGALNGLFSFVGLDLEPSYYLAILCGLTALGLLALDALLAGKTEGGTRDA
jgi:hypothetical protein